MPGVELGVALVVVRPTDDDSVSAAARQALAAVAEARGGVEREVRADEINDAVPSLVEILAAGGDVFSARVALDKVSARLPGTVAPGSGITGVVRVPGKMRRGVELVGVTRGRSMRAALKPIAAGRRDPAVVDGGARGAGRADRPSRARARARAGARDDGPRRHPHHAVAGVHAARARLLSDAPRGHTGDA
jgi:hypothetical protein